MGDRQHPKVREGLHTLGSVSGLTRYTQAGTAAAVALGPLRAIELAAKLIATALPKLRYRDHRNFAGLPVVRKEV